MQQAQAQLATVYMPDGRPAPWLLTTDEVLDFLRVDQASVKFPHNTLERIRKTYDLRAVQVGKAVRYRLPDVLDVLDRMAEVNPR